MSVLTVLLDFSIDPVRICDEIASKDLLAIVKVALEKYFEHLKFVYDLKTNDGYLCLFTDKNLVFIQVQFYEHGLITLNIEYFKGEQEKQIMSFEYKRELCDYLEAKLEVTGYPYPNIKRDGFNKYFCSSDIAEADLIYTETLMQRGIQNYEGKEICILGGGDGALLYELLKEKPGFVTMLEIDEMVMQACNVHLKSICGDVLERRCGDNFEIIVGDCMVALDKYVKKGKQFDYVFGDLTDIPISETPTGEIWNFIRTILQQSFKILKPNGKYITHGNGTNCPESLRMYEEQLKQLEPKVKFTTTKAFVPSFMEEWVFYQYKRELCDYLEAKLEVTGYPYPNIKRDGFNKYFCSSDIAEADLIYTETLMQRGIQNYEGKEICILGGGDGALLYELLKEKPGFVTMLEIDEMVMQACNVHLKSICGDVLERRCGDNFEIIVGDCMVALDKYVKKGKQFDYVFGDLTDIPISETPTGEIWNFIRTILQQSFKILKPNGKYITHGNGTNCPESLRMYEEQLKQLEPKVKFTTTKAFVPSFMEEWVFYQYKRELCDYLEAKLEVTGYPYPNIKRDGFNKYFCSSDIAEADLIYTETLMQRGIQNYEGKEICILGGGDGALLYELLKEKPGFVTMLEIDEMVMQACNVHLKSICGDVLERRCGDNFEIIVGDCMVALDKYVKKGKQFDYVFGDLTDIPISETPTGEIWNFIRTILQQSFKILKPNGKYITHGNGTNCPESLRMYEEQLKQLEPKVKFTTTKAFVPSFMEEWVFYQYKRELCDYLEAKLEVTGYPYPNIKRDGFNKYFCSSDIAEADLIYTETLMQRGIQNYEGKEICILGGGDGALLYELLKEKPGFVTMLEIDEMVMQACNVHLKSICGDVLERRCGDNFEIIVGDCMVALDKYVKKGKQFDYVFGDLTDIPISETPTGEIWNFIRTILQQSFKILKPNGKYITHGNGTNCPESLRMYEEQLKQLEPKVKFTTTKAFVPSFMEEWVFYQYKRELCDYLEAKLEVTGYPYPNIKRDGFNKYFCSSDIAEADLIYTETLMQRGIQNYEGKEICILGGGDGALLYELLKEKPGFVTMLEIDEMVMQACNVHLKSICGDVLERRCGDNFEIIVGDCMVALDKYVKKGKQFDYVFGDLTDIPISETPTGEIWNFIRTILQQSFKILKPNGKYITHGNGTNCPESLRMYEEQLKQLEPKVKFTTTKAFVPSFMEEWVFYQVSVDV